MRNDIRNQFSDAQVVTAAAVSTNSMEKKVATQDLGIGQAEMGLVFTATVDAVGGGSFTVELIEADNAALTTSVVSLASMTVTAAKLLKGKGFFLALPGYAMTKKFFGARFTPVGGTSPSLTVDAYFGAEQDTAQYKSFVSTYTVDN
jgi:hypothetical protein